jgi:hypothetical protein
LGSSLIMNIYGIINGQAQLVQSPTFCTWEFNRYEEGGSLKPYIGFECTSQELIPENGQVIENFNEWANQYNNQ